MKKGWYRLALLSLSLICTLIFSGCAMMQIAAAPHVMGEGWKKVDKTDQSTLSAFKYVDLYMQEYPFFKQYIDKNGCPDYVYVYGSGGFRAVFIEKEIQYNFRENGGYEHSFKEIFRDGVHYTTETDSITKIPEVIEHLEAKKIAEEKQRALEEQERQAKWRAEQATLQEAKDKARQEEEAKRAKRQEAKDKARQEEEAEQAKRQEAKDKARQEEEAEQAREQEALEARQRVEFDDSLWVIKSALDMGNALRSNNQFVEAATTEGKFIKITYSVKNKTKTQQKILAVPRLADSADNKYLQYEQEMNYLQAGEKCMVLEAMPAGMTKTFTAIYEVPADAKGLKFEARTLSMMPDLKCIPFELKKYDPMDAFKYLLQ